MEALTQRIFRYCLGDRNSFPLERRVLNALILASSLLATLLVVEAIAFDYQKALVLSSATASIFWVIYLFSRNASKRESPLWIYLLVSGLVVIADRFFVGGHAGLALLILVAISGTIPLITRKDQLKTAAFLLLLFWLVICTLTTIYWYSIPVHFPSKVSLLLQVLESGILMTCLFSVAYLAISSYRHEKEQVTSLNAELIQQERLATLGRLTATVSHELRNPLGTVRNAVFSISDELNGGLPEHLVRLLSLAERNIDRCVDIIEELLDYTRVKELAFTETSLTEWVHILTDEYELSKGLKFELDLADGPPVLIDREKLRQVLLNLLTNASDALLDEKSNGNVIKVFTHYIDDDYLICVQDDGIGMSEETMAKVFEPLFSTKGFGTGLGMDITKKIVEQHHGTINITSSIGAGTTVTLRLPVCPMLSKP
jgi:signal transduction histidine kinase